MVQYMLREGIPKNENGGLRTMAIHLNEYGLKNEGFEKVAEYILFQKGFGYTPIKCFKSDAGQYLVRVVLKNGYPWDHIFKDSESANKQVKYLLSLRKWYKKIYWKGQYILDAKVMKSEWYNK